MMKSPSLSGEEPVPKKSGVRDGAYATGASTQCTRVERTAPKGMTNGGYTITA